MHSKQERVTANQNSRTGEAPHGSRVDARKRNVYEQYRRQWETRKNIAVL